MIKIYSRVLIVWKAKIQLGNIPRVLKKKEKLRILTVKRTFLRISPA